MAAKPRVKVKTYKIGLRTARADVVRSITKAQAALAWGRKAVKRARKRRDVAVLATNLEAIQDTRWTLRNLEAALDALDDGCKDQVLNSDPSFEG